MSDQLERWLAGESIHDNVSEQCVPDFSCCGKPMAPKEIRERFVKAINDNDDRARMEMLGMFLASAFGAENVYVAGLNIEGGEQ